MSFGRCGYPLKGPARSGLGPTRHVAPSPGARASCPRQTAPSTLILGRFFLFVQRGYWISYMLFLRSRTGPGASFRDYTADQSNTPHAVMEAALAQTIRSKVEAAHARRIRRPSRSTRSLTTVSPPRSGLRTTTSRPRARRDRPRRSRTTAPTGVKTGSATVSAWAAGTPVSFDRRGQRSVLIAVVAVGCVRR